MSERHGTVPASVAGEEPNFAYFWGWVARENLEEDLFRFIATTPGLDDQTWMVKDVEEAVRQFSAARKSHIQDILNGWDLMERGMNKEIARQVFNEIAAGCRTLTDFENRNFSKKNESKPRAQHPQYLSGNPMMLKWSFEQIQEQGLFPTTPQIYGHQSQDFFSQQTNSLYYDMLLGDSKVFDNILKNNQRNPNMPQSRIHPIPYHPNMQQQIQKQHGPYPQKFQPAYNNYVSPAQPMQYIAPAQVPQISYQMVPQFMPMPMTIGVPLGPMQVPMHAQMHPQMMQPMQPMQEPMLVESAFAGQNYQQILLPNGNVQNGNNQRGHSNSSRGRKSKKHQSQQPRNVLENENVTTSSSSSSSTVHNAQSTASEEDGLVAQSVEFIDDGEQGPSQEPNDEKHDDADVSKRDDNTTEVKESAAPVILPFVRKFSDVVSRHVSSSGSRASSSNDPSELVANVVDEEDIAPVLSTSKQSTPSVTRTSQRTAAEVVQQSLSVATPPIKNHSGPGQPQPSPTAKTLLVSPKPASTVFSPVSKHKGGYSEYRQQKRPSVSYAQMLNVVPGNEFISSSSSSSPRENSVKKNKAGVSQETGDWHTVNPKKAAEPIVLVPEYVPKPQHQISTSKPVTLEPSVSEEEDDDVKTDDSDAEKKRQRRRNKRQKIKEEHRQQKQTEKEVARQESIAKVNATNGDASQQPPPPVFDRNNLAARRRKRLELQRKTDHSDSFSGNEVIPTPPTSAPPSAPVSGFSGGNSLGPSISAGQTAMAAYGLSNHFRQSSRQFAIIAPNANSTLPIFLPPMVTLEKAKIEELENGAEDDLPIQLARKIDPNEPQQEPTEVDENAKMIERLLMFDSLEKLYSLKICDADRMAITKGLDDVKRMYVRVEKAGKLVTYKFGSSKVSQKHEENLMQLAIKLLSNKVELSASDDAMATGVAEKVSSISAEYNYTNFLTVLLDFTQRRARELPDGTNLRKNYEQSVVLTKVFLKRTKTLYEKIAKFYDFSTIDQN
uniref:Uncharacterized protein n=1 Tax=Caenorhabditis japonica TaxID=281687 RepID=A0A8R1HJ18_CAEJA